MRARLLVLAVTIVLLAIACVGTTGDALVDFPAAAAGPVDAAMPLVFTTSNDWNVTLTEATLHVGAIYLDQSRPTSGAQDTPCILPGTYVAQETTGMDVNLLSSAPQTFPALAHGTTLPALVGQVWLTGTDINSADDPTPILQIAGTATQGPTSIRFTGTITIGANREAATTSVSGGAAPICKQRIVSPIITSVPIGGPGGLLLRVDPRLFFTNIDFSKLATSNEGGFAFSDDPTSTDYTSASINLYNNLRSAGISNAGPANQPYQFSWDETLTPPLPDAGAPDSAVAEGGSFVPPADPGPDGVIFAVSGEVLALQGYPFPPASPGAGAFVDGWDVSFSRLLVTVDKVTLSQNPDFSPGDQSLTGPLVAEVDGPWAVDLSHSDANYLAGKGGPGEEAVPIATLSAQNLNNNQAFATDSRYAFGFQTVAASSRAINVNMDAAGQADYQDMIANQCSVFYVGTAIFKGGTVEGHTDCNSDPEYANWPKTINFRLCYKSPTSYLNCQNPDNDPAVPLGTDEHQRGISFLSDKSVIAQITIHTDHPFWDSVLHDSPAHFDQFAARVAGQSNDAGAVPTVTLEMTQGVDYTAYTDALGRTINWRYCMDPPTDVHGAFSGIMSFDPESVPHATSNNPATGLRDYYDYTTYNQSTQGHLNSDGLCFVRRNYLSPP